MRGPRRIDLPAGDRASTSELVEAFGAARLVCFPTDTVYGVGGRLTPQTQDAVVAAKGREPGRPLQVVYPTVAMLEASVDLVPRLRDAVRRLLPGPFTLLVPYPEGFAFPPPGAVTPPASPERGGDGTLAASSPIPTLGVRVPAWPQRAGSLALLPFALLASSANLSGGRAARVVGEVDVRLLAACDLVLDAGPVGGTASTVVDLTGFAEGDGWRILREGAVDDKGVAALLGAGSER